MDALYKELERRCTNLLGIVILQHANPQSVSRIENVKAKMISLKSNMERCKEVLLSREREFDSALAESMASNKRLKYICDNLPKDFKLPDDKIFNNDSGSVTPPEESPLYQVSDEEMITPGGYRRGRDQSPYDYRTLAQPLQTPNLAQSPQRQSEDMVVGPVLGFVSESEFDTVPAYMKGRMKVDVVNEVVDVLNKVLDLKYEYIKCSRAKLKSNEKIYDIYPKWKQQQKENNNELFCTEQDMILLANFKLTKKEVNIITILRHLKRLKQTRTKNIVYYIANS